MISNVDMTRVQRWVDGRNAAMPPAAQAQVRIELEVSGSHLTVVERRVPWRPDAHTGDGAEWTRSAIGRLHYKNGLWMLYWRDQHQRYHAYQEAQPTDQIEQLLAELDEDPTGIFWG